MTATAFFIRLGRWGLVGFSVVGFVATFVQSSAFYAVAGHTQASRAAFGSSMVAIASTFSAVFPPPLRPETVGGYVWWRGYQAVGILFAVWALASATAMVRTDETRGVTAAVLATGTSRVEALLARLAAFAVAAGIASGAVALGYVIGVHAGSEQVDSRAVLGASVLVAALTLSCYAIALLVAQLAPARAATAAAAIVLLALFLANSLSRVFTGLSGLRWISPFRYYELNQPLAPDGSFDARSAGVLVAIAIVTAAAAALAFERRDIGSPLIVLPARSHAPRREQSRAAAWSVAVVRELYERRAALLTWCAGAAALAVVLVAIAKATIQPLLALPTLFPNFGSYVRGDFYPTVLGYVWFNFAELLFAGFAIAQVARWAAEDGDGRLEAVLSQPRSRAGVVTERLAAAAAAAALVAAVSGVAVFYGSQWQGIELDPHRVATATLLLVPFALDFAAAGALLAAWKPRAAVGVLGGLAFGGYLDTEVGPLLKLPGWLQNLSPFHLYGTPLTSGLDERNLTIMLLIFAAGFGTSILALNRRDIGS